MRVSAELLRTYRAELDRLGRWDRDRERRYAAERVANELDAWDWRPVYAYGFEDLTARAMGALEALSGRADVTVSLPYEPGRLAFSSWNNGERRCRGRRQEASRSCRAAV